MLTFRTRCLMTLTQGLLIRVHGLPALAMNNCSRLKLLWPTIGQKGIHFAKTKWAIKIKTDVDKKEACRSYLDPFQPTAFGRSDYGLFMNENRIISNFQKW